MSRAVLEFSAKQNIWLFIYLYCYYTGNITYSVVLVLYAVISNSKYTSLNIISQFNNKQDSSVESKSLIVMFFHRFILSQ